MTWLFDSHIHLSDPEYHSQIPFIIRSMEKLNMKACCVSMDFSNSEETLELANKCKLILPFIGIHPERASDNLENMVRLIEQNSKKICGIGEIGLDRTYVKNDDDFNKQKHVFETLLSLAEKLKKPVSIHSRKTLDEIFDILPSYSIKILLHWFDGNKKQLQKAMDMNLFVSYGPVMIYAKDKQVLLSKTDHDKFLIETDGPVRFSRCFGMKTAQIDFIPSVLFCASKVLRQSYEDTAAILEKTLKTTWGYRYKKPRLISEEVNRIKRISREILEKHKSKFGEDFTDNKKALAQISIIRSKGLKNEIAGFITKLIKNERRDKEIQEEIIANQSKITEEENVELSDEKPSESDSTIDEKTVKESSE